MGDAASPNGLLASNINKYYGNVFFIFYIRCFLNFCSLNTLMLTSTGLEFEAAPEAHCYAEPRKGRVASFPWSYPTTKQLIQST